jgi:hypothetical protein
MRVHSNPFDHLNRLHKCSLALQSCGERCCTSCLLSEQLEILSLTLRLSQTTVIATEELLA